MTGQPTAGEFDGAEHVLPVRVYYEDTDFTGLVYHASYVRFFERGRSDFLRLVGADHVAMAAVGTAFAVLTLTVDFQAAARIDDALEVRTRFERMAGARIHVTQRILRDSRPIARADLQIACIDPQGHARRPPASLQQALAPYLG
jgi:acyl-CoA thioester hydrolase